MERDARGWPKGRARQWDARVVRRLAQLHAKLTADPQEFFTGATAIQQHYGRRYPTQPVPPLRTIGRILADLQGGGQSIATMDCLIATLAIIDGARLVSRNKKHFSRVPGLALLEY